MEEVQIETQDILVKEFTDLLVQNPQTLGEIFRLKEIVKQLVLSGSIEALVSLGFDPDLIPVMQLYANNGPGILGTYSHPTEVDLYKIVAAVRLVNMCIASRIPLEETLVVQYDTRDKLDSANRQLGIDNLGTFRNEDPMSIGKTTSTEPYKVLVEKRYLDMMRNEIAAVLKAKSFPKTLKPIVIEKIKEILLSRLELLISLKPDYASAENPIDLQSLLAKFNIQLARIILGIFEPIELGADYLKAVGEKTLSESSEFRALILEAAKLLIEAKGIDIVKKIIVPGSNEGLVLLRTDTFPQILTVNINGDFELRASNGEVVPVADNQFLEILTMGLSLGKLESLLMAAGALTIHAGSDHGAMMNAVDVLGINSYARQYLGNLQLGGDKSQGHEGVVLKGKFVPLPLQFLMLGSAGIQRSIEVDEVVFDDPNNLKRFFAENLVEEALVNIGYEA